MKRGGSWGRDFYTLASGREFYAHAGVIGIDEVGNVHEGYDGDVEEVDYAANWADGTFGPPGYKPPLTAEERREIAEEMVARWRKWGKLEP